MKVATITCIIALSFPATASAFLMIEEWDAASHVAQACTKALASEIECDSYIPNMNPNYYQKWVGDTELADEICIKTCHDSFPIWYNTVAKDCADGSDFDARSTTHSLILTISQLWQGFNETCIKDTESGHYCQEILDGFSDIARGQERPAEELCHPCYGKVLAVMSKSFLWSIADLYIWPPTEDDLYWQGQLDLVQKKCGGSNSTAIASSESPERTVAKEPSEGPTPHGPTDPGTPSDCSFFTTITYFEDCWRFASDWGITVKEFVEYNPTTKEDCSGIKSGYWYCVEANNAYSRTTDPHKVTTTHKLNCNPQKTKSAFPLLGVSRIANKSFLGKTLMFNPGADSKRPRGCSPRQLTIAYHVPRSGRWAAVPPCTVTSPPYAEFFAPRDGGYTSTIGRPGKHSDGT